MVDWSDPRVIVAIYAAVVSTSSLLWNICVLINNTRRKLNVQYNHLQTLTHDAISGFSPVEAALGVEVTNVSKDNIHIKNVSISFNNKKIYIMSRKTSAISCIDRTGKIKYPLLLKHGEVFKDINSVKQLLETINNQLNDNDKLQFIITDTLGKKHKSKFFKYGELKSQYETEKDYNTTQKKV